MAKKVTTMVLKVDLECSKCYNKIKKTLRKFPQIRDQVYDEKQNTVTIKVMGSNPEMTRDKIRSKGGVSINSIEIKAPEKPKETAKKLEKPKEPAGKKKEPEKHKIPEEKKKKPCKTTGIYVDRPPCYPPFYPRGMCCRELSDGSGRRQCFPVGPPPPCYCNWCYGRPVCDSWCSSGCNRGYCGSCDENPPCAIM